MKQTIEIIAIFDSIINLFIESENQIIKLLTKTFQIIQNRYFEARHRLYRFT